MARKSATRERQVYAKIGQLATRRNSLARRARSMSARSKSDGGTVWQGPCGSAPNARTHSAGRGTLSGIYRPKPVAGGDDLAVMRRRTTSWISNFRSTAGGR